jgi:hypothetical protein
MKIKVGPHQNPHAVVVASSDHQYEKLPPASSSSSSSSNTVGDDFFDSFGTSNNTSKVNSKKSTKHAKQKFNQKADESDYWNGVDLLRVAASATKSHLVIYDMPRNTVQGVLGQNVPSEAGYRGNLKLEEHYFEWTTQNNYCLHGSGLQFHYFNAMTTMSTSHSRRW